MIVGHLAVSALLHRYFNTDLCPTLVAGVVPDLVDKSLCQGLRLTPSGRMFGHTLLGLGLSTAVVRLLWGPRSAASWVLGYVGHLVADLGGLIPWMYPFLGYDFPDRPPGLWEILKLALSNRARLGLEIALVTWALVALCQPGAGSEHPLCRE